MIRKETVHIIWGTIQAGLVMLLLGACSTTKHLPEGEILYTGSKTIVENEPVSETFLIANQTVISPHLERDGDKA